MSLGLRLSTESASKITYDEKKLLRNLYILFWKRLFIKIADCCFSFVFSHFFSCSFLWGYSIQDLNCCNKIISSYAIFVFPLILNYSIVECFKCYYDLSSGLKALWLLPLQYLNICLNHCLLITVIYNENHFYIEGTNY